jgi:hypothetical protein
MHDELWAGPLLKLEYAAFHLQNSRLLKGLPEIITVSLCKLMEQLSIRAGSDQSIRTWMRFSRRRGVSPR